MQRASLVSLLFAIILQGCGYKGPLHLPTGEPAKPSAAEQPKSEQPASNHQDNKQ